MVFAADQDVGLKSGNPSRGGQFSRRGSQLRTRVGDCHRISLLGNAYGSRSTGWRVDRSDVSGARSEELCTTSIGWSDPANGIGRITLAAAAERGARRRVEGDSWFLPLRRSVSAVAAAGGNILNRWFWRYWQPVGAKLPPVLVRNSEGAEREIYAVDLPEQFDEEILSLDLTFKDTKSTTLSPGPSALSSTSFRRARGHLAAFRAPDAGGYCNALQHDMPGIIAINPEGGKAAVRIGPP